MYVRKNVDPCQNTTMTDCDLVCEYGFELDYIYDNSFYQEKYCPTTSHRIPEDFPWDEKGMIFLPDATTKWKDRIRQKLQAIHTDCRNFRYVTFS